MPESSTNAIGYWRLLGYISDGEQSAVSPGALMTVDDQEYSVTVHGKVIQRGRTAKVTKVSLCQSDVTVTEGIDNRQRYAQISQVQGMPISYVGGDLELSVPPNSRALQAAETN